MFQKLARAAVFAAWLILVTSRIMFSAHPCTVRPPQPEGKSAAQGVFIVYQLQIRRF